MFFILAGLQHITARANAIIEPVYVPEIINYKWISRPNRLPSQSLGIIPPSKLQQSSCIQCRNNACYSAAWNRGDFFKSPFDNPIEEK